MPKSSAWSTGSAPCRLEWRPSRILVAALRALGALAAAAVIASEVPVGVAVPMACAAVVYADRLARREAGRPRHALVVPASDAPATADGAAVEGMHVQWRGPLAFVRWRDGAGRMVRVQGWPDNLGAVSRRELRLAMAARGPAHSPRSVAP